MPIFYNYINHIFRDYDSKYLEDKTIGVEIAINKIVEKMKSTKK